MKVKKANAGSLTNFEVLEFFRSRGASKDSSNVMSSLVLSEFKVFDYLVTTPACDQTRENIQEFVEKSKVYHLARAEVINIINIRPSSAAQLVPLIEDSRMDDDKLMELAEMVEVLPPPPNEENAEEEPAMNDDSVEPTDDKTNNAEEEEEEEEKGEEEEEDEKVEEKMEES